MTKVGEKVEFSGKVGTPGTGKKMSFDIATISSYITKLNKASQDLRQRWLTLSNITIKQVQVSWAGKDANQYIENVLKEKEHIEAICSALELLAKTYQIVVDKLRLHQEEMVKFVRNSDRVVASSVGVISKSPVSGVVEKPVQPVIRETK